MDETMRWQPALDQGLGETLVLATATGIEPVSSAV
jgi:hypothetical protein